MEFWAFFAVFVVFSAIGAVGAAFQIDVDGDFCRLAIIVSLMAMAVIAVARRYFATLPADSGIQSEDTSRSADRPDRGRQALFGTLTRRLISLIGF